jgi:hypothetical protein
MGCATKPTNPDGWKITCEENTCEHFKGIPQQTIWYIPGVGCNKNIFQSNGCPYIKGKPTSELEFLSRLDNVRIITLSFGEAWLFKGDAQFKKMGAFSKYPKDIVIGHSAGAFNAFQICNHFKKCVFLNPMFVAEDPFKQDWYDCLVPFKPGCFAGPAFISKNFKRKEWPQYNPIQNVKNIKSEMHLQYCAKDEFDLITGPREFVKQATQIQALERKDCTHYDWDVKQVLGFIK